MNITVYCGSKVGNSDYKKSAQILGEWIAKNGNRLVYGGGKTGLMGIVADTVLENQGEVIGVTTDFLVEREVAHRGLTKLEIVETVSIRKSRMIELGEAFIALPGGPGTLDEITEVISLAQIGKLNKPCIFFNYNGYYQSVKSMYDEMNANGFLNDEDRKLVLFSEDLKEIEKFILFKS